MNKRELLKGLTKEQRKKAMSTTSHEELLELAKEEGIELPDGRYKCNKCHKEFED